VVGKTIVSIAALSAISTAVKLGAKVKVVLDLESHNSHCQDDININPENLIDQDFVSAYHSSFQAKMKKTIELGKIHALIR